MAPPRTPGAFEALDTQTVVTEDASLHVRTAGSGTPLLFDGYPQTGAAWHAVAPGPTDAFRVVVPDLRGYGQSRGPADPTVEDYTKRTLARETVSLMVELGHQTFAVAGHDRGASGLPTRARPRGGGGLPRGVPARARDPGLP